MAEITDQELVRQCLLGNTQVFGKLVDRYQKTLFNKALQIIGDEDDAKDVTQTVFIKAYNNLKKFNPEFKFFSWIYKMLVNESINHHTRLKGHHKLDPNLTEPGKNPEEEHLEIELNNQISEALMHLSLDYRLVIVFYYFGELTYREVSYVLDIPEKTVKSRLYSARQKLVEILKQMGIYSYEH